MANAIGNKSLFYSKYESYKKVKKSETKCVGRILIQMAKKAKSKTVDQTTYLKDSYERTANPLWQYLNMLLALKTWKRYMLKYDSINKDEVDIDSTDFLLEEFEEQKAKKREQELLKNKLKLDKEKKKSRRSSVTSRQLSQKGSHRGSHLGSNAKIGNITRNSRENSKRSSVVAANIDFANLEKLTMMEDQMDLIEKNEIEQQKASIEQQLIEEKSARKLVLPHDKAK